MQINNDINKVRRKKRCIKMIVSILGDSWWSTHFS